MKVEGGEWDYGREGSGCAPDVAEDGGGAELTLEAVGGVDGCCEGGVAV